MHNRQQAVGQPALDMPRQIEHRAVARADRAIGRKELVTSLQVAPGFRRQSYELAYASNLQPSIEAA